MASRRLIGALTRHFRSFRPPTLTLLNSQTPVTPSNFAPYFQCPPANNLLSFGDTRRFSSRKTDHSGSEDDADDDDDDEEDDGDEGRVDGSCDEEEVGEGPSKLVARSGKTEAEKVKESSDIGYKVVGPLTSSENPFKPYEPVFAVVQIGSHQFKVSNGDSIFTERLKYCEVNDKLILGKVLMLGSKTETIIGRPILPDATVHAVVEEHALNAKVIIFKKKRRKNYRRTKGHRQELTKLRITDIQGIDKSENVAVAA